MTDDDRDPVTVALVTTVASINGLTLAEASALMLPDEPRLMTPDERAMRAKLMHDLYAAGLSLRGVGDACGGLSRERVRQIMFDHGYDTRPLPGSKRWRDARRDARAAAAKAAVGVG